jgi:TP901 family phage tail tape measure protein
MSEDILRTLVTELQLKAGSWNNDIKAAEREAKAFATEWKATTKVMKEFGEALSVVGDVVAVGLLEMAKKTAEYGAELERMSLKTGASVQDLARLGVAAEENGSSMDALSTGLKFISKNMELAGQGSKAQVAAFQSLGITTKDLTAIHGSASAMFSLLADRIKGMADPSEHAADLTKILGKNWTELIPTLALGSEGLREAGIEAENTGKVLSDTAAAQGLEFAKSMEQLKASVEGLGIAVGSALIPTLTDLASWVKDGVQDAAAFAREHENWTKVIFVAAAAIGGAGGLLLGLAGLLAILPSLTAAWALLSAAMDANPIGLVVVGISALVAGLIVFRNEIAGGLATAYGFMLTGLADIVDAAYRAAAALGMTGLANSISSAGNSIRDTAANLKDMGSVLLATEPTIKAQGDAHVATAEDVKTHYTAVAKLTETYTAQKAEADALKIATELMDDGQKNSTELLHLATKAHWDLTDAMKNAAVAAISVEIELEAANARAIPDFAQEVYDATQAQRDFNSVMGVAPPIVVGLGEDVLTTAKKYDTMSQAAKDNAAALKQATDDVKQSAGKIFDDMFIKGESVFSSLQDALKGGALSIGRSIFEDVVGYVGGPIKKAFDDMFTGLMDSTGVKSFLSGLGNKIAGLFGGGTDAATSAAGEVSSAAGAGSSAASSVTSSLTSAVSAISGVVTAISSVIGNFQMARLEGTMNAVEFNTRSTYIEIKDMMNGHLSAMLFTLGAMNQSLTWINMAIDITNAQLVQIKGVLLAGGGTSGSSGGSTATTGGGGGGSTLTQSVDGFPVYAGAFSSLPGGGTPHGYVMANGTVNPYGGEATLNNLLAFNIGGGVAGTYQMGTDYVPRTGIYQLHKGEAVVPAEKNQNGGGYGNGASQPVTIIVQVEGRELARTLYELSRNEGMQLIA